MNAESTPKSLPQTAIQKAGEAYFGQVATLLQNLDLSSLPQIVELIQDCRDKKGTVFLIGNGGSAATANHMANDLSRHNVRARSLTENMSTFSATANDFSYDEVFSKPLEKFMQKGDILLAISASGNSPNILKACDYCLSKGHPIIGLTGFDGGELLKKCTVNFHVATTKGEYGPVEDIHMALNHFLANHLKN